MSKDKRKISDEEYQFPEEEYVSAEQSATDTSSSEHGESVDDISPESEHENESATDTSRQSSRFAVILEIVKAIPILKNTRVLAVIGIAIVALIGFKIMAPSDKASVKKPVQTQPKAQQAQISARLQNQLSSLQQGTQQSQTNINQLQQKVQNLDNELNQTATSQARMSHDMVTLVNQVKQLTAEVKAEQQPKKKIKRRGPLPPKIVYHLKAIVPGRAWIVNNFGEATTVSIGDKVRQYGRVEAVDPQKGEVITTSGKLIRYGVDDS